MKTFALAVLALLLGLTVSAFAAGAAAPDEGSILDLLRPVIDAFKEGHHLEAGMLALVLAVAALKRYAPEKWGISKFVHGDIGGVVMTLVGSFAGAMATTLAAGDTPSWAMSKTALMIAVGAAGGYAIVKKLLVEPLRNSEWYKTKAPSWFKSVMGVVLWVFDKPDVAAQAERAGDAAVVAKPAPGVEGVVGKPDEIN